MIVESYEDVVILTGALRSNYWETIHTAVSLILRRHPEGVIIDCSHITECTPEGAETFHDAMDFINANEGRVIVAAVPEAVLDVLKSVPEVRSQLPIAATIEEARSSLNLTVETSPKKKKRDSEGMRKIIVCLSGGSGDINLISTAISLANDGGIATILVYPILMPRELPLQSPMPAEEAAASAAFSKATIYFEESEIPVSARVERARDIPSAIEMILEEVPATTVVIGLPDEEATPDASSKLVKAVLAKIPIQVVFTRGRTT
ncbi:MAG: hypothetical protein HONBIEJF_01306 [Fimbriimonadaceae bacterium]|nr:hypothetical protein [Fimbriimonadaceae bacterium]